MKRKRRKERSAAVSATTLRTPILRMDHAAMLIRQIVRRGQDGNHRGILPNSETALFIPAGEDLEKRLAVQQTLNSDHCFARKPSLWLEPVREGHRGVGLNIIEFASVAASTRLRAQVLSQRVFDGCGYIFKSKALQQAKHLAKRTGSNT